MPGLLPLCVQEAIYFGRITNDEDVLDQVCVGGVPLWG